MCSLGATRSILVNSGLSAYSVHGIPAFRDPNQGTSSLEVGVASGHRSRTGSAASSSDDEGICETGELDDPTDERLRPSELDDGNPLDDAQQDRKAGAVHEVQLT
jgi:hypothetical protein